MVGRDGEGRLVRVSGFEGVVEYGYDGACQLVESRGRVVSSWRYDVGGCVVNGVATYSLTPGPHTVEGFVGATAENAAIGGVTAGMTAKMPPWLAYRI
ncbi:hypothetical protein E2R42_02850 [Rathayibacter toxicus]|uniref:hypothetical protein n=1 Tax=Rathayibacter toxicus TaxID=145458 RepID=UPI0011B6AD0A|nr:hypothetical protein [Rathayibacter toxicus]QWL46571.1 hypothetical protein E2R42_02850 [Rathayibacter toxicus]